MKAPLNQLLNNFSEVIPSEMKEQKSIVVVLVHKIIRSLKIKLLKEKLAISANSVNGPTGLCDLTRLGYFLEGFFKS